MHEYSVAWSAKIIIWLGMLALVGLWIFSLFTIQEPSIRVAFYFLVVPLALFFHMMLNTTLKARMVIDESSRKIYLHHWGYSTGLYDVLSKKLICIEFDDVVAIQKFNGRRADSQRIYTAGGVFQFPDTISEYVKLCTLFEDIASKNSLPPTKMMLQEKRILVGLYVFLGFLTLAMAVYVIGWFL